MSRICTLLFVLFVSAGLHAQQYRCFQQGDTSWYEYAAGTTHYFNALHIDSAATLSGDSVFYNYRVAFMKSPNWTNYYYSDTSWLGRPVIRRTSGRELFYNQQQDSIVIETQAGTGNSWRLLELGGGNYIEATVSGISPQNVLGQTDNVKTITLQAKDASNLPLAHDFNGKTILLGENSGFVRIYNLYNFPNDTVANTLAGKTGRNGLAHQVNAAAIFDFNIGDRFDYRGHENTGMPPSQFIMDTYETRILTAKQVNGNTITFTWNQSYCKKLGTSIIQSWYNQSFQEFVDLAYLDTAEYLCKLPEEEMYAPDPVSGYYTDILNQFCYQPGIYFDRLQRKYGVVYPYSYENASTSWVTTGVFFDMCEDYRSAYAVGLGKVYDGTASPFTCSENNLVYYEKGTEIWGTPNDWSVIMGENSLSFYDQPLKVYPVPAEDFITLQLPLVPAERTVYLYDISGRLLDVTNWPSASLTRQVTVSHLPAGVYRFSVEGPDGLNNAVFLRKTQ